MKKLIFLFTMVLAIGMTMAQNKANLTQTGENQEAIINQAGLNTAKVTQFTDNKGVQKSTVIQSGERNVVVVEQNQTGGGGNSPANTAFIQQIGNDNYGNQYEKAPGYNSGQKVEARQIGNSNDVRQSIFSGYTESLFASQTGNENDAIQEATGGGHNHANISQLGNLNWAKQEINGNNNGYSGADILIEQNGASNKARQLFTGNGQSHKNNGNIYQVGDGNDAFQEGSGRDLNLRLLQNGDNNKSTQKSWGIANVSWLNQEGDDNTSKIIQEGDENSSKLYQSGIAGKVDVLQNGNKNTIGGIETEFGNVFNLKASQLGENNELLINSTGTVTVLQDNNLLAGMVGNKIKYYQTGLGITRLSQVGDENNIGLLHGGNGNANIKQEGNSNKVGGFVDVFAGDPVMNDPFFGTFNGEKLTVDQFGEGNLLNLHSTGLSDIVTVLQHGNNNAASVTQSPL